MDVQMPESLFFMDLPDLRSLCAVNIILNPEMSHSGIRDVQIKLCRHLLFLYDNILASPVPEQLNQILVIIPISFYKTGKVQSIAEKHRAKMDSPERVTPAGLQTCLSYTLIARLAPHWNKAGHLLIQGGDFLEKSGKQDAVAMYINVSDTQICISVQVHTIRLPPCELSDFNITTGPLQSFLNGKSSVIMRHSISSNWCYILPSMKMGQIISIRHDIPLESPFKTYKDFQTHWNMLYGYELPNVSENDVMYCSVYFKLIGEKLFTYPFICLRSQPVQYYPRVDLARVLSNFVDDLKSRMSHLCGVPTRMSNTPVYPVKELTSLQSQGNNPNLVNLTTKLHFRSVFQDSKHSKNSIEKSQKMVSVKEQPWELALGQLHSTDHHPSSWYGEPITSSPMPLGSQSSYSSVTHIGNVQRYVPVFQRKVVQVSQNNLTLSTEDTIVTTPYLPQALKKYNTSDSKLKHVLPVNALKCHVKPTRPSLSKTLAAKGKTATSNLLNKPTKIENNREPFKKTINTTLVPCSSAIAKEQFPNALCQAHGKHRFVSYSKNSEPPQSQKSDACELNCVQEITAFVSHKRQAHQNDPESVHKSTTCFAACSDLEGSIQEEYWELNPKNCRTKQTIKEVDVEKHARNNQLFKLSNATLQNWLKHHGISTKTRDKKEQLVTKIMQFIQES